MKTRQILWLIAGTLWILGAVFQGMTGKPAMVAMYVAIGAMNICVALTQ